MKVAPEGKANRPVKLTRSAADESYPDWSPGGNRIAFSRGTEGARDVYVMRMGPQGDSTNRPRNLTSGSASDDYDPSWSPNGEKLAFTSDRTGDEDIWSLNADGTKPTNLTERPGSRELQPDWRPLP
jgi:TolB protein